MATQKKKRPSMLQQAQGEAEAAEKEAARLRMKAEMTSITPVAPEAESTRKPKSKAQQIKERRPLQVSIHFTQEEKYAMEDAKTLAKRMGIADATVEDFVHGLVVAGLRSIEGNPELVKRIMEEDGTLTIK